MAVAIAGQAPPSDDRRWKVVDARMRRLGYRPDALVEALHSVQESFGFLDRDALEYVAGSLRVPPSRVYGVATFYSYLHARAAGRPHVCRVHGNGVLHQRCDQAARRASWRLSASTLDRPRAMVRCLSSPPIASARAASPRSS